MLNLQHNMRMLCCRECFHSFPIGGFMCFQNRLAYCTTSYRPISRTPDLFPSDQGRSSPHPCGSCASTVQPFQYLQHRPPYSFLPLASGMPASSRYLATVRREMVMPRSASFSLKMRSLNGFLEGSVSMISRSACLT